MRRRRVRERRAESLHVYGVCRSLTTRNSTPVIHALSGRLPRPCHDVADLAHTSGVSVADAGIARAPVAIIIEAVGSAAQDGALFRGCETKRTRVFGGHLPIQRSERGVAADCVLAR